MTEELNQILKHDQTIANTPWPTYDKEKLIDDEIEIPVQVNGKLKATVKVPLNCEEKIAKEVVHSNELILNLIDNKTIVKEIYVKNKIYNIVIK